MQSPDVELVPPSRMLVESAHRALAYGGPVDANALDAWSQRALGVTLTAHAGAPQVTAFEGSTNNHIARTVVMLAHAEAPDAGVMLELDSSFARRVMVLALGAEDVPRAHFDNTSLNEVEKGVLGYTMASALEACCDAPWRIDAIVAAVSLQREALPLVSCAVEVRVGVDSHWARLWLNEAAVQLLDPMTPSAQSVVEAVEVELSWVAAYARISRSDWTSIAIGDALTFDTSYLNFEVLENEPLDEVNRLVTLDRVDAIAHGYEPEVWQCGRHSEGFVITTIVAKSDSSLDVDNDWVDVHVEVGRSRIHIGELRQMRPGSVLITHLSVGDTVTLRVAHEAAALGELVYVDGELAARICSVVGA